MLLVLSAIFVALGLFMLVMAFSTPFTSAGLGVLIGGLVIVGFFGLLGGIGLYSLIVPARLEIGPTGITQKVLWRTLKLAWTDVYNFRPAMIGLTNKTVGYDYLTPKQATMRRVNRSLTGIDGALAPGLELAPPALADLLNNARERWLPAPDGAPQALPIAATALRPPSYSGFVGARMNRKIYWLWMCGLFAVSLVLRFAPALRFVTLAWSIRIFAVRLHDIGRSGWWQAALYAVQILAIVLICVVGRQPFNVGLGIAGLIQLIFTAVLGAIPGDRGANRFGPAPGQPSPIAASETFR